MLLLGLCVVQLSRTALSTIPALPWGLLPTAAAAPLLPAKEEGKRCDPEVCSGDAQKEPEILVWRSWEHLVSIARAETERCGGLGLRVTDIYPLAAATSFNPESYRIYPLPVSSTAGYEPVGGLINW